MYVKMILIKLMIFLFLCEPYIAYKLVLFLKSSINIDEKYLVPKKNCIDPTPYIPNLSFHTYTSIYIYKY